MKKIYQKIIFILVAEQIGSIYLNKYLSGFERMFDAISTNEEQVCQEIFCKIITSIESNEPLASEDIYRLRELYMEIKTDIPIMKDAYIDLLSK